MTPSRNTRSYTLRSTIVPRTVIFYRNVLYSFKCRIFNLQNLDLIALAETHLQDGTSNATLVELLSNWQVQFRFDSGDGKKHMGLLILASKSATDFQLVENLSMNRQGQTQVQVVSVSLSGKVFSFVYIRTTPTLAEAQWLQEKTLASDFILGDLNSNPLKPNEKRLIEVIGGQKKMIFRGITTPQKNQLDHILGDESAKSVFATSYFNFIREGFKKKISGKVWSFTKPFLFNTGLLFPRIWDLWAIFKAALMAVDMI